MEDFLSRDYHKNPISLYDLGRESLPYSFHEPLSPGSYYNSINYSSKMQYITGAGCVIESAHLFRQRMASCQSRNGCFSRHSTPTHTYNSTPYPLQLYQESARRVNDNSLMCLEMTSCYVYMAASMVLARQIITPYEQISEVMSRWIRVSTNNYRSPRRLQRPASCSRVAHMSVCTSFPAD